MKAPVLGSSIVRRQGHLCKQNQNGVSLDVCMMDVSVIFNLMVYSNIKDLDICNRQEAINLTP